MFVLKKNGCDGQPSQTRLQSNFPQETASVTVSDSVRQCPVYWRRLFDYVI